MSKGIHPPECLAGGSSRGGYISSLAARARVDGVNDLPFVHKGDLRAAGEEKDQVARFPSMGFKPDAGNPPRVPVRDPKFDRIEALVNVIRSTVI
jgi:hypothetical protein